MWDNSLCSRRANMFSIRLILFVIASCGAQELTLLDAEQDFTINAVELSTQRPDTGSRIIGGSATTIENYPYTVQILYYMQLICAGSLLTSRNVLSAAHCFVDQRGVVARPSSFAVRVGTSNLNTGGEVHRVSAIIVHERYNQPERDNDIALVLLSTAVRLSNRVQIAKIPVAGAELLDDSEVVVVGWGRTNANIAAASPILNQVSVRTVNRTACAQRYGWLETISGDPYPITDNMLCAGLWNQGGADACQGDSGGPLIYGDIVVGVTSWGYGCAERLFPGVYAKVSRYTTWANHTISRFGNGSPNSHSSFAVLLIPIAFLIITV